MDTQIKYTDGYKYQLSKTYTSHVDIYPDEIIALDFITLDPDGTLTLRKGFAYDGPSGPTKLIATALKAVPIIGGRLCKKFLKTFMRGASEHDALYKLMRHGLLSDTWRRAVDKQLIKTCEADGMSKVRRNYVYRGVRVGAGFAADPKSKKIVMTAP